MHQSSTIARPTAAGSVSAERVDVALETGFDFLGAEYRDLFRSSSATAFQHPLWLDAFYRILAPARGAEPVVVTGRDAVGVLRFVLPMIRRQMMGVALVESADLGVSDYSAPVFAPDLPAGANFATYVAKAIGACDILRIKPIREETVALWGRVFDAVPARLGFSAHAATPTLPHAEWRTASLDASFVKYLARRRNRFMRSGNVEFRALEEPGEIAAAIEAIRKLRSGRFEGDPIQSDHVRDFYAGVAAAGALEGFARTYRLGLDGEPVGQVFGLTHAGRFHYLLIGCDYETWGRHSPGLILYDLMMEDWAKSGGDVFDFTIGDEAFKADFATSPTAMYCIQAGLTLRGRMALLAADAREQVRILASRQGR